MSKILELADQLVETIDDYPFPTKLESEAAEMLRKYAAEQDYTRAVISERDQSFVDYEEMRIERDQLLAQIAGWKAEQKENLKNQCDLHEENEKLRKELAELKEAASMQQNNGAEILELRNALAELRQEIDAEPTPVAVIVAEDMGRPFNAMQIRTHFYSKVPPVGTQLYTHPAHLRSRHD